MTQLRCHRERPIQPRQAAFGFGLNLRWANNSPLRMFHGCDIAADGVTPTIGTKGPGRPRVSRLLTLIVTGVADDEHITPRLGQCMFGHTAEQQLLREMCPMFTENSQVAASLLSDDLLRRGAVNHRRQIVLGLQPTSWAKRCSSLRRRSCSPRTWLWMTPDSTPAKRSLPS